MIKLRKLLIILILCLILTPINVVMALDHGVDPGGGSSGGGESNGGGGLHGIETGNANGGNYMYTPTGYAFNCSVTASSCTPSVGIYLPAVYVKGNFYDVYNNNIENKGVINKSITAGMSIGVDLYEERSIVWWAKGFISETLTCQQWVTYKCMGTCCANRSCTVSEPCETECSKIVSFSYSSTSWSQSCQNQANQQAYNLAKSEVEKNGASYSLTVTDPNDARCGNPEKYAEELKRDGVVCNNYSVSAVPGETTSFEESLKNGGKVTKKYHYEMYGACINVKTGKVRYLNKNDTCNADEYFIENDNTSEDTRHWHVFTPLNTKTPDGYTLSLTPNTNTIQRGDICQAYVDKYSTNYEYTKYIKPTTGSFIKNVKADKKKVINGCYFQTIINFPTVQKFYGEEIDGENSTLIGFNFYYRPIEITNPFPNGIASDSYWKEWGDSSKKDPDLSKSFNEVTYYTNGIDLTTIREYNDKFNYTNWTDMNINGSSDFIAKNSFLERNSTITNNSFYSLGCGLSNMCEYLDSEHTKKNPLYQKECLNNKVGVSCP